jgi:hypothetical protein
MHICLSCGRVYSPLVAPSHCWACRGDVQLLALREALDLALERQSALRRARTDSTPG